MAGIIPLAQLAASLQLPTAAVNSRVSKTDNETVTELTASPQVPETTQR